MDTKEIGIIKANEIGNKNNPYDTNWVPLCSWYPEYPASAKEIKLVRSVNIVVNRIRSQIFTIVLGGSDVEGSENSVLPQYKIIPVKRINEMFKKSAFLPVLEKDLIGINE